MRQALGMIEVVGLSTGIFVADIMIKTSNIEIIDIENTRGLGYMTVKIAGDVGAVNAAISSGKNMAISHGKYVSSVVIARPHDEMYSKLIKDKEDNIKVEEKSLDEKTQDEELKEEEVQEELKQEIIQEELKDDKAEDSYVEDFSFKDENEDVSKANADLTDNNEDTVESGIEEEISEEVEKHDTKKNKSVKKVKSNKKK